MAGWGGWRCFRCWFIVAKSSLYKVGKFTVSKTWANRAISQISRVSPDQASQLPSVADMHMTAANMEDDQQHLFWFRRFGHRGQQSARWNSMGTRIMQAIQARTAPKKVHTISLSLTISLHGNDRVRLYCNFNYTRGRSNSYA
jgi:hypothetical protein